MKYFEQLAAHSSVWIFQADRALSSAEQSTIQRLLHTFIEQWNTHGKQVAGDAAVLNDYFVVFAADEQAQGVSGCSKDSFTKLIHAISAEYEIDFFQRFNVVYQGENHLQLRTKAEFIDDLSNGIVTDETLVYNNLIDNLQELRTAWAIPFASSWHKKVYKVKGLA